MTTESRDKRAATRPSDSFYGDLRKAAYLKRLAEYRLLDARKVACPAHGGK